VEVAEIRGAAGDTGGGGIGAREEGRGDLVRVAEFSAEVWMMCVDVIGPSGFGNAIYWGWGISMLFYGVRLRMSVFVDLPLLFVAVALLVLVELRQRIRNILQLHYRSLLAKIERVDMHGADVSR